MKRIKWWFRTMADGLVIGWNEAMLNSEARDPDLKQQHDALRARVRSWLQCRDRTCHVCTKKHATICCEDVAIADTQPRGHASDCQCYLCRLARRGRA